VEKVKKAHPGSSTFVEPFPKPMRKLLPLLLLLSCFQIVAQPLESGRRTSYYRYVFRIADGEARELYRKGMEAVTDSYFRAAIDSFPVGKVLDHKLPVGHYLLAHTEGDQLVFELQSVNGLGIKLLNNRTDLTVHLHDSTGRNIPDAKVEIKGRRIPYDQQTSNYKLRRKGRRGLLAVSWRGFTSYHPIETQYKSSRLRRTVNRLLYSLPVRYTWQPFRDIFQSIRQGYRVGVVEKVAGLFDPDARERRFSKKHRGFIAFNKPRYQPGDTVKLKAVVLSRRGKPIRREVTVTLLGNGKPRTLTKLKPYRDGAYAYAFALHDSLRLSLDTYYSLYLENPKGKPYLNGGFKYEDYELEANTFKLRSETKAHSRGQPLALYLKGTDENELNLLDARVEITLLPGRVLKMRTGQVLVADTLWQHKQALEPVGETKIVLPDSLFPPASLEITLLAEFFNASNERHVEQLNLTYHHREEHLRLKLEGDSLRGTYIMGGKPSVAKGMLTAYDQDDEALFSRTVGLPFAERVNPYVDYYEVETDSLYEWLELADESPLVQCNTNRTADSVFIQVLNPRRIPFWYTIYRQNERMEEGYAEELTYRVAKAGLRPYSVSLQYVWQGKAREEEYLIPFSNRQLRIEVEQPLVVYPGQKAQIGVLVTDQQGEPVPGADLTAYGVTKKFPEAAPPNVPDFSRSYRSRKLYNTFHLKDAEAAEEADAMEDTRKLDWPAWKDRLGLDSLAYYQFLYPEGGLYRYELPLKDSLTQLSPFVVRDGEILPVNLVWVDERPLYIRTGASGDRYVFPVDSGYHTLTLRTLAHSIRLDSVYVPYGKKLILSVDTRPGVQRRQIQDVPIKLSPPELTVLNRYLMSYRNRFGGKYAYLKQENRVFPLSPNTGVPRVGPVYPGPVQVVQPEGDSTAFAFESLYEYEFSPGLLKMRSQKPYASYFFPNPQVQPDFRELAWTEAELDSLWRRAQEEAASRRAFFENPTATAPGAGKFALYELAYPEDREREVKRVLLLKENDPDFLRVFPGATRLFHQLEPGSYRLMLLLRGGYYLEKPAIRVEANGTNYLRITGEKVRPPDRRSRRLDSLVTAMVTRPVYSVQEQRTDLQSIKETYNQTYNLNGTGRYDAADFTHHVSGVILDKESGGPLPGVNVVVKGTAVGTVTDASGWFSLDAPPNGVLVFSFIGYITEEALIGARSRLQVALMADVQSLSEVVVVGYSEQRRQDVTGSVSMVQGRVAGVNVTLRGNSTATASDKPLVIVDGVPFAGSPDDLDPGSLLSVESLPGTTATAIYGTRGANGVILISTRKNAAAVQNGLSSPGPSPEGAASTSSIRNRFSDYAFWEPRLTTDRTGKVSFPVTFPDDITSWRTFVAAVGSKKRTGVAEGQVKSFKTLAGNLALPRFLVEGDSTWAIGKALNYTADTIPVRTVFEFNDQVRFEQPGRLVHALVDTLPLTAASVDSLRVKYYVRKEDGYLDGELRTLPVFPQGVQESKGLFLNLEKDTTFTLRFDPKLGKVKLYAQADVLDVLLGEIDHVSRYEYLCNEQAASKLIALLAEKKIRQYLGQAFAREEQVRRLIRKLTDAQKAEGGWGWWPDAPVSTWISAHVAGALTQAEREGYRVRLDKKSLIDGLVFELEGMPRADKISALRLLSMLEAKVDLGRYVREVEKDTALSLAQYLELLEIRQRARLPYQVDTLLKTRQQTAFGNWYWGRESLHLLYSDVPMTLAAYRILRKEGGYEKELVRIRGFLLEKRADGFWRNTYESASILETILPDLLGGAKAVTPSSLSLTGRSMPGSRLFPTRPN
jgi:TonB-dependent SusC/RagA subfamily outer membrane receptor